MASGIEVGTGAPAIWPGLVRVMMVESKLLSPASSATDEAHSTPKSPMVCCRALLRA